MHFMTFSKSEIILVTKFMGSACLRGLHILFLGVFPRPISSDNSVVKGKYSNSHLKIQLTEL